MKQILLLFVCFITASGVTGCDKNTTQTTDQPHKKVPLHRVTITTISIAPVSIQQILSANLEPVTRVRFYSEESARITRLPFHEGDKVHSGDILIKLDDSLIRSEVEKARASYKQAQTDLNRLKKLLTKNISTRDEVTQAETTLELAKADVDYQRTRLAHTSIKAPIDGVITERLQEPGDFVAAQTHILTLIDPTKFRLKLQLAERFMPLVKINQPVLVIIDSLTNKTLPAKIKRIFPTINNKNHKGTIEVQLAPVPAGVRVGQFVKVKLSLMLRKQLLVPTRCIQLEPNGSYVYRIVKTANGLNKAEKISFEKGPEYAGKTTVLSGLHSGDKIVIRGFLGLRTGKIVKIVTPAEPAAE